MMTRYLSGLGVAGLGLCGGGWLVVAALAFGGESEGRAGRVNLLTGAVLIAVGCLSLVCWSSAWRRRLRSDGVLADRFPLVSRREARRNRRALSRDVRRAGKLAERSARSARRAARRSARLASGGPLSEGGVLGEGVALGVASPGNEQYSAAPADGTGVNGSATKGTAVNGTAGNGTSANGTSFNGTAGNGTSANGTSLNGTSVNRADARGKDASACGVNGAGVNPGERAAELIGELRSMLAPLLAATGGQPALAEQLSALVGQPPSALQQTSAVQPLAAVGQPSAVGQPALARQPPPAGQTTAAAPPPLPQRSRFASELRPRVTAADLALPGARSAPMSIPRLAPASDDAVGPASDGEDTWW
jgi:hypothetical protein